MLKTAIHSNLVPKLYPKRISEPLTAEAEDFQSLATLQAISHHLRIVISQGLTATMLEEMRKSWLSFGSDSYSFSYNGARGVVSPRIPSPAVDEFCQIPHTIMCFALNRATSKLTDTPGKKGIDKAGSEE